MSRSQAGFSLLETLTTIGLLAIVSGMAVIQMKGSLAAVEADDASNLVRSQFNYARQLAVNERRNVVVGFWGNNEIKVTRQDTGGGSTVMADVTLPGSFTFALASGAGDTPDGFNCGTPVYLNAATSGTFLGDGTFVDASSLLANGCVFTKGSGNGTARAVALAGATGKIKQYWLQGTTWVAK